LKRLLLVTSQTAHQNSVAPEALGAEAEKISWAGSIPFFLVHGMCLFGFYTGVTWKLLLTSVVMYYVWMWSVTAGYHRYFSHRTYKTGRVFQFLLAFIATTSAQKGVLWWAAHHRHHHRNSDQAADIHSPTLRGFWWSHVGWILSSKYNETRFESIRDFARFPELRLLNRFYLVPPILVGVAAALIGGFPLLIWGFFIPLVAAWHGTFTINSLSHVFGSRRYRTTDTSRNNLLLALLTCGEGWHNNHHYHQNTANQGWFWWEIDLTYYSLKALSWVGIVSDLKLPPESVKLAHLKYTPEQRAEIAAAGRVKRAGDKMREAFAAASAAASAATERLPSAAPSPSPMRR
jgi:stearoyl-CoA desaturase (delta-9 desaturase)